jgi:predicted alpha/beta hydrolase
VALSAGARSESLHLTAVDGYRLGATFYQPAAPANRMVLVMSATGVPQEYYGKFAAFLAERGFGVLTFDYRGIGRSRHSHVRTVKATMRDWARLDGAAALDFLEKERSSGQKLLVVGHSFGGQSLALLPRFERIAAALVVGSQSGYWRKWPLLGRAWIWPATHLVLPSMSPLLGYFPMSRFGLGEDLPAGVAIEWASWCRNPTYLVGALGVQDDYARFSVPLRAYAVTDDRFAPPSAVAALLELYPAAKSELRRIAPRDAGVRSIGHFGFFRERFRDSLWREAGDWLLAQ